jgi:HSP20 family protein
MKALMPWTNLPTLRQELDRLFSRFDEDALAPFALADWMPSMDVTESNGDFVVKLECPGMEAKDLHVRMEDGVLTVEGEKKSDREEKTDRSYRHERMFGSFSRDIRLPKPTDGSKINARLVNGVLTLTVPKAPATAGKKDIEIKVG